MSWATGVEAKPQRKRHIEFNEIAMSQAWWKRANMLWGPRQLDENNVTVCSCCSD